VPTEAELRGMLRDDEPEPGALDTQRIIRKARARRRPKTFATYLAGGVAAVGAIAFTVPAVIGLGVTGFSSASGGSAADEGAAGEDASSLRDGPESASILSMSAATLNRCGDEVAESDVDAAGLMLEVSPVDASTGTEWVETTVTLTNTGDTTVTTSSPPILTLALDGRVMWHGHAADAVMSTSTELSPGETVRLPATFQPVRCASDDEVAGAPLPEGLPPVDPGAYDLSAAIDIADDTGGARIVNSSSTAITLR